MKHFFIEEPLLEFANDVHICPRKGISEYSVYDAKLSVRKKEIFIGSVGASNTLSKFVEWMEGCKSFIPPKQDAKQGNLFVPFCGFNKQSGFQCELNFSSEIQRKINNTTIQEILSIENRDERILEAVEVFYDHVKYLAQNKIVDVVVCIIPKVFENKIVKEVQGDIEETLDSEEIPDFEVNFRRALKAKCMHLGKPLQLLKENSLKYNQKIQDDATRAWNFCTALYYKSGQTVPWRLFNSNPKPPVCYVGISFYKSRDKQTTQTSLAQLFDELGNGVILRGTPVERDKDDRQLHLNENQANQLLKNALGEYKFAMGNLPSRVVVHKTSKYNDAELDGFLSAIKDFKISSNDFLNIQDTDFRFFRDAAYPPLRGTGIQLSEQDTLLYTKGSVELYQTFPGMYIPQPILIHSALSDESIEEICYEILSLSKMNWNNTQFDGKYPITVSCARKVGEIMKYINEDEKPQIRYAYYM